MSFCTKSRISTLKWALSYDTPEIAHIARREVAYREIGALIDSIQLPPRDAFISTPTSPPAESYYSTLLHELTHNADIRFMPHRCHLPWSSLAERRRHSA
jgi:hypothetical protein